MSYRKKLPQHAYLPDADYARCAHAPDVFCRRKNALSADRGREIELMDQSISALRKPRAPASDWLVTGSIASILSAVMLGACGWRQNGTAATPLNGPSQWLWGTPAARSRKLDVRHTAAGYLIHHASSLMWAAIHHRCFGTRQVGPGKALAQGLATAAMAAFVDYRVSPRRFQPGFEQHVSRTSLALGYGAFGIALGLAHRALSAAREQKPRGH